MISANNDPQLKRFLQGIHPLKKKIKKVYLFGSRARGTERPDSDYDILLVVNENFSLDDKDKLYDQVMAILLDTGKLLSLKIFKSKHFKKLSSIPTPFMSHVLKEGIQIG